MNFGNMNFGKLNFGNMKFGGFNFNSLLTSLNNLKNMKPSVTVSSWPVSNTKTIQKINAELQVKARNILGEADDDVNKRKGDFNAIVTGITPILNTYETNRVNSINLFDSYNNYLAENKKLEKNVNDITSDIQTNDRKTFYQNEATDSLNLYYDILLVVYILTVIGFAVCWYLLPTTVSNPKLLFLFICLLLYPLFSERIIRYIMYLYNLALDYLPRNAYNK
jgi:hypothetical protein